MNYCAKHKELTVLTNIVLLLFDRQGLLTCLPLNIKVKDNYLVTILSLKDLNNIPGMGMNMYMLIEKAMNVILRCGTIFKFK